MESLVLWLVDFIQASHGLSFSMYQAGMMMPFIGMGDNLMTDYTTNRYLLWYNKRFK
jgi:hypothetical protein